MKKVIVIGCPGSGKSTFSRALNQRTGIPIVYLDSLFWNADKTYVTGEEFTDRISQAMKSERWIIDGNYGRSLPMRLENCDTVFFLDYPLSVCLEGVNARMGTLRPDLPWVETEPDPEFLQYIHDFHREQLPELRELLDQYPEKRIFVFYNREEAAAYLDNLSEEEKI